MEPRESYREWARSVRAEARRNLAMLRAERLARSVHRQGGQAAASYASAPPSERSDGLKRGASANMAGPLPMSVSHRTAGLVSSSDTSNMSLAQPDPGSSAALSATADAHAEGQETADRMAGMTAPEIIADEAPVLADQAEAPDVQATDERATAEESQVERAGVPDVGRIDGAQDAARPEEDPETPDHVDRRSVTALDWEEDALQDSPLCALPGAGVGLVWLLHVNGVITMEDLAAADPEQLRQALGLVGRLIDVEAWITYARAAT